MFSLLFHPAPGEEDILIAELWESGTCGIAEQDPGIQAFFEASIPAGPLLERFAEFRPELGDVESIDWAQVSRDAFPPLLVGQRFYLVAPWSNREATPPGRLRLEIEPGMACGTGRHPATQLCLEALERHVRRGDRVLDVGTGSGILAQAAALLGAGSVAGCDLDPQAIRIARRRVNLPLFAGSAGAVRSSWADVIVANIDSAAIELLADELARVRKPPGKLILSGFPDGDVPEGFRATEILRRGEWLCLVC